MAHPEASARPSHLSNPGASGCVFDSTKRRIPKMNVIRGAVLLVVLGVVAGCGSSVQLDLPENDISTFSTPWQVFEYAASGELDQVKTLIEADPQLIDAIGDHDWTPLHYAASNGHNDVVRYLLSKGASPMALDENAFEPIAIAGQRQHMDTVKILREAMGAPSGAE
jgi:ankyrin repeat protein